MFDEVEIEHDRKVSELVDLRPGVVVDVVMAGEGKVWRLIVDAVLDTGIVAHLDGGNPIRLPWYQMKCLSLPE